MSTEAVENEPVTEPINRIDIKEFRELGFLQEANRLFFHPLGLALEVFVEDDGSERLGGVWDYRTDPEGMVFGGSSAVSLSKAVAVQNELLKHLEHRRQRFGWENGIQPLPEGSE